MLSCFGVFHVYVLPACETSPHVSYSYICLCRAQLSRQLRLHVFSFQSVTPSETFQLRVIPLPLQSNPLRIKVAAYSGLMTLLIVVSLFQGRRSVLIYSIDAATGVLTLLGMIGP
jgi:hypothetical protein